ncbi:CPBP family intramembrane glutamic endopeptidase [Spirosoma sp. KNUC1025]|uniref:CPBP family intramembrane glutamic endopeptidase n=1 Tax=Spirosoma sp. KNUC1025 TaxID=2894082 RepID=UPI00386AD26F|nr:CPBP family intramembrane metalloprotease [Spirosoma sp. KNUC1025]
MTTVTPQPLKTGLTLWALGLVGIASLLTTTFPLTNLPKVVLEKFTPEQLQLLMLVNPTLFLIIAVVVGSLLYRKVNLKLVDKEKLTAPNAVGYVFKTSILPGIVAGLLILGVVWVFQQLTPSEMAKLNGADTSISPLARFLYGGITEEILLRFGLMTLFVWAASRLFHTQKPIVYWVGIILSALLFGAGHLPALKLLVPDPSATLTLYIILGNSVAGVVFGWIYWRYGLVLAMIAHAAAHVVLLTSELIAG